MEDKKNTILEIQYIDGTHGKRKLLSIFQAGNGQDYAALMPLNEDESVQDSEIVELVRVKLCQNDNMEEDYLLESISTETELQVAAEAYEVYKGETEQTDTADLLTLSCKNDKGQLEDWKVVDVFVVSDRRYIALTPVTDAEDSNINIYLMRLNLTVQGGVEGCEVTSIPSDMEYEEVAHVFDNIMTMCYNESQTGNYIDLEKWEELHPVEDKDTFWRFLKDKEVSTLSDIEESEPENTLSQENIFAPQKTNFSKEEQTRSEDEAEPKIEYEDPEIDVKIKAERKEEIKAEHKGEVKAESEEKIKAEPKEEIKAEPKEEIKVEPKEEIKAEPKEEIKAEPKEEVKAEPKEEIKVEPKEEIKVELKEEIKVELKEEIKVEPKEEIKVERKVKPELEHEAEVTAEPKTEKIKEERKSEKEEVDRQNLGISNQIVIIYEQEGFAAKIKSGIRSLLSFLLFLLFLAGIGLGLTYAVLQLGW